MAGFNHVRSHCLLLTMVCILAVCTWQRAGCHARAQEGEGISTHAGVQDEQGEPQWYAVRDIALDVDGVRYEVQIVFTRELFDDVHLYVYSWSRTPKLLLHFNKLARGRFLDVMTLPHPDNPENELLMVYSAGQYPMGTLWYVHPERKQVQKLLEGIYLDATYLFSRKVVTEWKPAHYVLAEGEYDFQLMARRDWKWDSQKQRFVPGRWRVSDTRDCYFHMIDTMLAHSETIGSPVARPMPVSAEVEAKILYFENWVHAVRVDASSRTYSIQIASSWDEAFLSVYENSGKRFRLVRCTRLDNFGYVVSLRKVPFPGDARRSLIAVYKGNEGCVLWRIDPKTMRPVQLMEERAGIDVSRISRGIVLEWVQALFVLVWEGWDAYPAAFRNPKAMAYRVWRWDKRRQQFVVATSWRIGQWSRENYRRFGFWE